MMEQKSADPRKHILGVDGTENAEGIYIDEP